MGSRATATAARSGEVSTEDLERVRPRRREQRRAWVETLAAGRESAAGPARLATVVDGQATLPDRVDAAHGRLTRVGRPRTG